MINFELRIGVGLMVKSGMECPVSTCANFLQIAMLEWVVDV